MINATQLTDKKTLWGEGKQSFKHPEVHANNNERVIEKTKVYGSVAHGIPRAEVIDAAIPFQKALLCLGALK